MAKWTENEDYPAEDPLIGALGFYLRIVAPLALSIEVTPSGESLSLAGPAELINIDSNPLPVFGDARDSWEADAFEFVDEHGDLLGSPKSCGVNLRYSDDAYFEDQRRENASAALFIGGLFTHGWPEFQCNLFLPRATLDEVVRSMRRDDVWPITVHIVSPDIGAIGHFRRVWNRQRRRTLYISSATFRFGVNPGRILLEGPRFPTGLKS